MSRSPVTGWNGSKKSLPRSASWNPDRPRFSEADSAFGATVAANVHRKAPDARGLFVE